MARVTVEDCVDKVPNRFELVLLAGRRARAISAGAALTIDRDNDKNPVVALREIAERTVDPDALREEVITSLQKYAEADETEEEARLLLSDESEELDEERMSEAELLRALQAEAEGETRSAVADEELSDEGEEAS